MPEKDVFVNQAYLTVTESAANTLTFNKLETGISIHEKVGWVIARLDYNLDINATNFAASADGVMWGISTSDLFTVPGFNINSIIDFNSVTRNDLGTAASGLFLRSPFEKDFSSLPGNGILIPPNPLFVWVKGANLTSAIIIKARLFYTVKVLKLEDFWELVELRRMIGT